MKNNNKLSLWLLIGTLLGIFVIIFQKLFSLDKSTTNIFLFISVAIFIILFLVKNFIDYYKLKKNIKIFIELLSKGKLDKYLNLINIELSKKKGSSYKQVYLFYKAIGFGYNGNIEKALKLLEEVYTNTKPQSNLAIYSLIYIIYFFIFNEQIVKAQKIYYHYQKDLEQSNKLTTFNILNTINQTYLELSNKDLSNANSKINFLLSFPVSELQNKKEILKLRLLYNSLTNDKHQYSLILEELSTYNLFPLETAWLKHLNNQLI